MSVKNVNDDNVRKHIDILQNIINRMAQNSSSCKTWCISIISAIYVFASTATNHNIVYIAYIPTFLFLILDAYYLGMERDFRKSYNEFVEKYKNNQITTDDIFIINFTKDNRCNQTIKAVKSFSVIAFYILIFITIYLSKFYVI